MKDQAAFAPSCPLPATAEGRVELAHGGGGRAMTRLIESLFLPAFDNLALNRRHDGATIDPGGPCAFSTDSYVVRPLFFPGGDIGSLAVNGTANDLAMCGARPLYLSAGFILEEGLPLADLARVVASMAQAARATGVSIVTGDVKVVERGKADGLFINTSGVGRLLPGADLHPGAVQPGDAIVLSGDIGRHGIAVMAARESLGFEALLESDCAPVAEAALALLKAGVAVRCLRDPTRGGVASALVEIAEASGQSLEIDERAVPVLAQVSAACELLGFDPLHVANEGRFLAFVAAADAGRAVEVLRCHEVSKGAVLIGTVGPGGEGRVTMRTAIGGNRIVDMLSGEQLPRIC
jgi:hydrogenase expression/formation protein HypE